MFSLLSKLTLIFFYEVDEVWKYAWENGTVPARAITDRAINLHRRENRKK
jgi:hypothetical protein